MPLQYTESCLPLPVAVLHRHTVTLNPALFLSVSGPFPGRAFFEDVLISCGIQKSRSLSKRAKSQDLLMRGHPLFALIKTHSISGGGISRSSPKAESIAETAKGTCRCINFGHDVAKTSPRTHPKEKETGQKYGTGPDAS